MVFTEKRLNGRFFQRAAAAVIGCAATLLTLSGCGSGGSDTGDFEDARNATFTRAYLPLQENNTHVFLVKASDADTESATIQQTESGPSPSINGIDDAVFRVNTTPLGSDTVLFSLFQNVTDRGFISYGADSFDAFDIYGNLRSATIGPRLSAPLAAFAPSLRPRTRASTLSESIRYAPAVVLPFGLERGRSTTIQRLDFYQAYSSDGTTNTYLPASYRFTNEGRETVTVPMGTFDCVRIKQELGSLDLKEIDQVNRFWYAENIGLVKYKEIYPQETPSDGLLYQAVSAYVSGKQYP